MPLPIIDHHFFLFLHDSNCLIYSKPVLFSIFPKAFVDATVRPLVHSIAVFFIINVLSFKLFLIAPNVLATAMHFSILPLPDIVPSVFPLDHPVPIYLVVLPLTKVARTIWPHISSHSLLLAIFVAAEIF